MASTGKGQDDGKASAPARKTSAPKAEGSAKGGLEERIKQRAYELWEADGRPQGQHAEHWARAERELTQAGAGRASAKTANGRAPNGAGKANRPSPSTSGSKPGAARAPTGTSRGRQTGPSTTKKG
jgi:hypothetical protein